MSIAHISLAEILREHVTLEVESIDRIYLNVYIPRYQREPGASWFTETQVSGALFGKPELLEKLRFKSTNFPHDQEQDEIICPAQNRMVYVETQPYKSWNRFLSERRMYECLHCATCPLKTQYTEAKGNRQIQVGFELRRYRQQATDNLFSEQGLTLQQLRSIEPETVFGDIKHNKGFRRFMLRGLKKVEVEWGLVCTAPNMRKLAIN